MALQFNEYNDEEIYKILRNLGNHENLNVKTLLTDFKVDEKKKQLENEKMKKRGKKGKFISKADKIRELNKIKTKDKLKKEDLCKLDYYKNLEKVTPKIIADVRYFKTQYGKDRMKYKFLKIAYQNKDRNSIIDLYLQLIHVNPINSMEKILKQKIHNLMVKINYKQFQFEHLSNRLPPLDLYNNYEKKLEQWQIDCLKLIENSKDVIVCAKTSMGKTWMSMYPALIGRKTLFIVPTKPLAYQVASVFTKFLSGSTSIIIDGISTYNPDDIVLVGTPREIETKLPFIINNFKIVVCDEIHNLNSYDGGAYERLIKIFSKKATILALSATIGNSDQLKSWMESITDRPCNVIQYSTRFINLQRYVWTSKNTLEKIHPFSCLTFESINDQFMKSNLPLTPYDNIQVYKALSDEFDKNTLKNLNLDNVFPEANKRLTLNDSKHYENLIKETILEFKHKYPIKIRKIINKFNKDVEMIPNWNLYNLFKQIKIKQMTPCIAFQMNKSYCKEIFEKMVIYLEKLEQLNYPYHYSNLEWLHDYYVEYQKKREKYEKTLSLGKNDQNITKEDLKEKILKEFDEKELGIYIDKIKDMYNKQIRDIKKKLKISDKVKNIQIKNLEKDLYNKMNSTCIKDFDYFEKHPDFCLNSQSPMSANEIREIRRDMCKQVGIKIDYNNIFIQGLKRGIGIYTQDMPEVYNLSVQALAQNAMLGFCISDKTLGMGINMPFKTACILGYKDSTYFSKENYEQFIGRAGRRGYDTEGNCIYCNVDWKILMKGELGNISGRKDIIYNYNVLSKISHIDNTTISRVFSKYMNPDIKLDTDKIENEFYDENNDNNLLWKLRKYDHLTRSFIDNMDIIEMKFKKGFYDNKTVLNLLKLIMSVFIDKNPIQPYLLIENISEKTKRILNEIKTNTIIDGNDVDTLIELCNIIKTIHNTYMNSLYYLNTVDILKNAFNIIKDILKKNQCLNSK